MSTASTSLDDIRKLLREILYRAREVSRGSLAGGGSCGLGETPGLPALTPELSARLDALAPTPERRAAALDLIGHWLADQDKLDRERNHFLKGFRREHGFDRRAYAPDVEKTFSEGLDRINAAENERAARCAEALRGLR